MDPVSIIAMIQAAAAFAGPAITAALAEFQVVGADISKHASALQTFQDAVNELAVIFAAPPVKPTA
jgi:hypothetical protein